MKTVFLKNNETAVIREAVEADAAEMVEFYNRVGAETDFLSFGGGEYVYDVAKQAAAISADSADKASVIMLALCEGRIVGIATVSTGSKRRIRHIGVVGIVIELRYCGQGLGRIMMDELISWSRNNGITKKLNLVTRKDNQRAIKLYESLGFVTEGVLKMDSFEGGRYYDSLAMGMVL